MVVTCVSLAAIGTGIAEAQTAPAPTSSNAPSGQSGSPSTPSTTPVSRLTHPIPGLTITGTLRGFDFQRLNTPEYNGGTAPTKTKAGGLPAATGPDRQAVNFGGDIRADYAIEKTGLVVGGAFWGAYPFGLDGGSVRCAGNGGALVPSAQCSANNAGIDNTLPGFPLETFEYYVKYISPTAQIAIGNQLLNKTWLPSSDSRIKPSLYQAADGTFNVTKQFSIGATVVTRFEDRTESTFSDCTLITCNVTPAGVGSAGGPGTVAGIATTGGSRFGATVPQTPGADRIAINFKNANLATDAEVYRFNDIADLTYFEQRFNPAPKSVYNPFIAGQFVNETNQGESILGKIQSETYGIQLGINATPTIQFIAAADQTPWQYAIIHAASASAAAAQYWVPGGGTDTPLANGNIAAVNGGQTYAQSLGGGMYKVAYGGMASPYTDSYASDPIYTTSITQGMVERRSPGTSLKGTIGYTSLNKKIVFLTSAAIYNYDSAFVQVNPALRNRTYEYDADLTYKLTKAFSIRTRVGDRDQPTLPYNFKYVREQLQYAF